MSLMFLDAVTLVTHDTTPPPLGRVTSTVSSHVSDRGAAGHNFHRIKEASRRRDTCNIVIFGETGSGKSSLVNLITGRQTAQTSPDATGCTTEITLHEHDVVTQGKTVKVQLFDTPGLDEGPHGTVSTMQGHKRHLDASTQL
ncbi:hypothetical protein BDR07DRAFT_357030 [Suillus spraguei]|nr:hypothetical protein BDR07DRAFT_357030 [Suillus spraguei]